MSCLFRKAMSSLCRKLFVICWCRLQAMLLGCSVRVRLLPDACAALGGTPRAACPAGLPVFHIHFFCVSNVFLQSGLMAITLHYKPENAQVSRHVPNFVYLGHYFKSNNHRSAAERRPALELASPGGCPVTGQPTVGYLLLRTCLLLQTLEQLPC